MIRIIIFLFFMAGCSTVQKNTEDQLLESIHAGMEDAAQQYRLMMKRLEPERFPKSYSSAEDRFVSAGSSDWCSGFYPGTLFYLYEQTGDTVLLQEARRILTVLEKEKNNTGTHDLGFMMYCSFGNAQKIVPDSSYEAILIQSARSLSSRFNPVVGCIKSWDRVKSWDGKTTWLYPVIIDNMMNLELLFYATRVTGDSSYYKMAVSHAAKTMEYHIRPDFSSYHVVNYDAVTGEVKSRETHQGYADNSTWARGQAWGVYGFAMVYRETGKQEFLKTAIGMADYFLEKLPEDTIPAWDFNANQEGFIPLWKYDADKYSVSPKDASAAAILASALIELAGYVQPEKSNKYITVAEKILTALSSSEYTAPIGENGNFILMHSTGNMPGGSEIDAPLTYADYYFVEAVRRYKRIGKGLTVN